MIWIRRILALLLGILFLPALVVVLVLLTVNDTFLNPAFYINQLRQADIYNFLYDQALPSALEDVAKDTQNTEQALDIDVTLVGNEAIKMARQILPPDWIQSQVEQVIGEVLPYLVGDTDRFTVTVPLADRIEKSEAVIKETLRNGEAFDHLYEKVTIWAVDETLSNADQLPLKLNLQREELIADLRTIVPKEWILDQTDHALEEIVPYLVGSSEHFAITIVLADRVEAIATVAKKLVRQSDAYDSLLEEVVTPVLEKNLGQSTALPFDIELTSKEMLEAISKIFTAEWVQRQLVDVIDSGVGYMTGKRETVEIRIPFAERKAIALDVLGTLADQKLRDYIDKLPECRLQDLEALAKALDSQTLPCRPPDTTYEQLKQVQGIDIPKIIRQALGESIPNEILIDDRMFRKALDGETVEMLDQVRKWITEGITLTDADLRESLDEENAKLLDTTLDITRNGFTFDEADLRSLIQESSSGGSSNALQDIDRVRRELGTARRFSFVPGIILAVLLLLIGLLGGRNPASKLTWAAAILGIAAVILYIATGPLYAGILVPLMDTAIRSQVEVPSSFSMVAEKGIALAESIIDAFIGGVRNRAAFLLIVAAIALGLGIVWQIASRRRATPDASSKSR